MNWSSVVWSPLKSLFRIFNWSVEVFSFRLWSINIVFACHYLEIECEIAFNVFSYVPLRWLRIYGLSSFPVIFNLWIEEMMISNTIGWCLIDVLELISVLMLSATFIEILLVLSMITVIVLTVGNIRSIIPSRYVSPSGHLCSLVEPVHFSQLFI